MRTWFITGASRGLGRSLAEALLQRGEQVAATARDPSTLEGLTALGSERIWTAALDVTNQSQMDAAVAGAIERFGQVQVLVNNAGYGLRGAAEEATADQVERLVRANLLAPMALTRAFLPHMRQYKDGYIVQISSVGGQAAFPTLSAYHATKWGLEGFSESLAAEVEPFGIKVMIVEPGGIRTDWGGSSMEETTTIPAYEDTIVGQFRRMGRETAASNSYAGDPDRMANAIIDALNHDPVPLRLPLGAGALAILASRYETRREALNEWETVAKSVDFPSE
jgi:NAD(P)-dependent dehydrogenase (short-subunit alcohol dehydrogenase family)